MGQIINRYRKAGADVSYKRAAFSEVNQMGQVKSSQPLSFVFNHPSWLGWRMGCVAN